LQECVRSLLDQTVRPDELVVVDDGALPGMPLEDACTRAGIRHLFIRKDVPGLTASRNAGIRRAGGDIVFFLDDDVTLEPDYIEQILRVYAEHDDGDLGGVGGVLTIPKPMPWRHRLRHAYDVAFLISGRREGKALPSGFWTEFGTTPRGIGRVTEVDFLPGGVSSYKQAVLRTFRFSEGYEGYGQGEDKDFSYRVSRRYRLLVTPAARLRHHEAPAMRADKVQEGRRFILTLERLFRDHLRRGPWNRLLYVYAVSGYVAARVVALFAFPSRSKLARLRGLVQGLLEIPRSGPGAA
jgi:glycosyltransferase involved in cell wall biosynthesis